tara:strand:- start:384 stop:791 length:408 start_codon:yes stop_codon:yes gene_type:complete
MEQKYSIIGILWIIVFTLILYRRNSSNNIILLCALLISFVILKSEQKTVPYLSENISNNEEIMDWLDSLINSKNDNDKDRCYIEIRNMLYSDSLLKEGNDHKMILNIISKYKPKGVLPFNIENDDSYSISTGFTK